MEETKNDDNVVKVNLQDAATVADVETTHKVDLSQPPPNPGGDGFEETVENKVVEEVVDPVEDPVEGDDSVLKDDDDSVLSEVTDDEESATQDAAQDTAQDKPETTLPENVQKLVEFINDTGGSVEDYVKLNKDIDSLDETQLLKEYHQALEPELDADEIDFLMEDLYASDEDIDEERDIKKKSIAKKRDLNKAKKHLQGLKDKYYDEIKAGSKLTPDQKKAVDFFDRHNSENEENTKTKAHRSEVFKQKSDNLFSEKFKGFEFEVGEKKYRYNVKNPSEVKAAQSDINNFAKKYLGDDNTLKDAKGYHKALFTAMNADEIANHFYQQGKADAITTSAKKAKNIKMDARGVHEKVNSTGFKARVVDSDNVAPGKLRIKRG